MSAAETSYEIIIGLEVHVQLRTETKLFCRCSSQFGAPPNTQVCPVCLGLPGALPVINERAVELSLRTGLALNCTIPPVTKWDRKQYFYPDLPKGYQISQYDLPICAAGWLEIPDPADPDRTRRIRITRAHLEEDAGKSMHDERSGTADSRIDLNRCGTPLLEIVSEPDIRTPAEARAYLSELKLLLVYLDVSDCEMQEGSLRVDANINLHIDKDGDKIATPIVEVKNMNSFRAVERALEFEARRQFHVWQEDALTIKDKPKTTRGWNDSTEETFAQREKEESADYRYFPDPDLLPIQLPAERIEAAREALGELPAVTRGRLVEQYGIKPYDAEVLVNQGKAVVDYYETVAAKADARKASAWIQQDILRVLNERQVGVGELGFTAEMLADLLNRIAGGKLDNARARDVFAHVVEKRTSIDEAIEELGIESVDESAVEQLCQELLAANPKIVADVQSGNSKAIGALIGQARKRNPNVNPGNVRQICLRLIESM